MTTTRRSLALAAAGFGVAGLLGLTACGDDDDGSAGAPSTTTQAATEETAPPAETPAEVTVGTAETDLDTILVDGDGNTLYAFTPDNQGPSTCVGSCLSLWPALPAPAVAGAGAGASLLGTAERDDGGPAQVTYNGWPLYTYTADRQPGDTNGQGVNDVWFVVGADGELVRDVADS